MARAPARALLLAVLHLGLTHVAGAQTAAADTAARLVAWADSAFAVANPESRAWAIARQREAVELYRRAADLPAASRTLQVLGRSLLGVGQIEDALASFHAALEIERALKNPAGEAGQLANIGALSNQLGRRDSARKYLTEANAKAQLASSPELRVSVLAGLGSLHRGVSPDSALFYNRAALEIARMASLRLFETSLLANTALVFEDIGQLDSAVTYGHQGLALARSLGAASPEGTTLQNLGNTYRRMGLPDSAMKYLRESLAVRRRAGLRYGEGRTLGSMGVAFNDRGAKDSAVVYLRASGDILRSVADRPGLATTAHLLGMIHHELGILDSALAYDREALALERQVGDRRQEGATLNNMINVFTDSRQLDSALVYGRLALQARRDVRDRQGEGYTLEALATVHSRLGKQDSALVLYRQSLTIARETKHRLVEASRLANIGNTFELLGGRDSALVYARAALGVARDIKDLGVEAKAMEHIADWFVVSGNLAAARATYDTAASIRNTLRRQAGADFARTSLAELSAGLYEKWTWAWTRGSGAQSRPLAALAAAERGRSQALLDLMRDTTAQVSIGTDLEAEGRRLVRSVTQSGAGGIFYLALPETLMVWVAAPNGNVTLLKNGISRDSLIARIGMLREALGIRESESFLATRGASLENAGHGSTLPAAAGTAWVTVAAEVARALLVDRALEILGDAREVVIVPHGAIAVLPFAALAVGPSQEPLGVRRALRYTPSLGTLNEAERRTAPPIRAGSTPLALVVGNPVMPDVADASGERQTLAALPGAEVEGLAVAGTLGAPLLSQAQASETEVRRRLPAAPVVHLASHGFAYSGAAKARLSFIALASDSASDGALTVGDILDDPALRLTADLVVLSACQTGLGNLKQAEGTIGLQRAFLARGARSVLVSLWSVSDEATRRLMESFYQYWLSAPGRLSKAEALRLAQEEVRKSPGFEHPRFWAGFQLVGAR